MRKRCYWQIRILKKWKLNHERRLALKPTIILVATYDTKGQESEYIRKCIRDNGVDCLTVNVGVGEPPRENADVSLNDLCKDTEYEGKDLMALPRGEAVKIISDALEQYVLTEYANKKFHSIIGLGGAGGTQIITQAMRILPFGVPKIMLTTLASGNTRWYLQDSDIIMFPSITDISGLNSFSKMVYSKFAHVSSSSAIWFANNFQEFEAAYMENTPRKIGMTMYGTTTKCVERSKHRLLEKGFEPVIFHASGAGGRAMEKMINSGILTGCLDMTIAEIGAFLVGGLHDAGPTRLEAAISKKIPMVLVPGAADTIVLPPMEDVPEKFKTNRVLNIHNPTMTTMRTNTEENIKIGEFICKKLKNAGPQVKILIPKGGLSSIDMPGKIFYNPEANEALFNTLKEGLKDSEIEIIEDTRHMYDNGFGERAAQLLIELMERY